MRLLLTGATGFLGGHLCRALLDEGHEVAALLRAGGSAALPDPRVTTLTHDGSTSEISRVVGGFAPEMVLHLASLYLASHSADDLERLLGSNVLFGTQLLQAMADHKIARMINFGTGFQHYDGDAYHPVSLYAATKQAFEDLAAYYVEACGMTMLTLKLSDTYGPGDSRGKIIALLMKAAREGRSLDMSPGEQLVNFVHSDDVTVAVQIAIARLQGMAPGTRESFAIRGEETLSLQALAAVIGESCGRSIDIRWGARPYRTREVMRPWLGPLLPGWQPRVGLSEGIRSLDV